MEAIFTENLRSAERVAARLSRSVRKLVPVMPIGAAEIDGLDEGTQESVDAFIKRFEQLQDIVENRLFRGIALLEQEDVYGKSKRDLTLLMEKFGVVKSADKWMLLMVLPIVNTKIPPGRKPLRKNFYNLNWLKTHKNSRHKEILK